MLLEEGAGLLTPPGTAGGEAFDAGP